MIVRIDTTNITRGREFTLFAQNSNNSTVIMRGLDVSSGVVADIPVLNSIGGEFDAYTGVAPQIDGYLLAMVDTQKVVKKIGNPSPAFVIGYIANYTVEYTAYDGAGVALSSGSLTSLADGFYFTTLPFDTVVVKCLNKNFIINKNLLKMNYEVTMSGGSLNATYENLPFDNATLPSITLPVNNLGNATLDAVLPDVTIKEL